MLYFDEIMVTGPCEQEVASMMDEASLLDKKYKLYEDVGAHPHFERPRGLGNPGHCLSNKEKMRELRSPGKKSTNWLYVLETA